MNTSITSLEGYIDTAYNKLANPSMDNPGQSHPASSGPSLLEHPFSSSTTSDLIIDDPNQVPNMSTPTVVKQSVATSTPVGINEGISHGFFRDLVGKLTKKRKTMSPLSGSEADTSLSEESSKIAEAVYNLVISDVSALMQETMEKMDTHFQSLESDLRSTVEDEMMTDVNEDKADRGEVAPLKEEVKRLREQLEIAIGRITRGEKERDDMKEELLQQQVRMMRDNLVFYNIPEDDREPAYECTDTIKTFLRTEMKVDETNMAKIKFDRVHRLGQKTHNQKRPIVAKFNPAAGRKIVLEHIKKLDKDKKFGVNEQLPRELEERKKKLLPKFKQARNDNLKPKWQQDKLLVGKKVTKAHKDRVMDINTDTTEVASQLRVYHAPPKSYGGSSFRGHHVSVTTQDDIIPALHAIYADDRVARATHNIYAYRLSNGAEHCEDDGEWGAGRVLLKVLKDHNVTDKLVCVTRWYGGVHLGKARFDHITEAAMITLQIAGP